MRVLMLLHKSVVNDSRVRREASTLAATGHDVVVLELADVGEPELDGFRRRSIVPPPWLRERLPSPLYRLAFLVCFVRGIRDERPDVIHAHDAAMLLPGLVGRRLTGARLVYDSHELATSVPYRDRAWAAFVAAIERIAMPRTAAVITVSGGIAARLQKRYAMRTRPVVVRNVSDLRPTGAPGTLRCELDIARDVPLVLHQGAPAASRGCDVLVRAVAQLDGVHLAFLGDPEDGFGDRLRELIAASGIGARVHMLPSVSLARLLDQTAEADVGVTLLQDTCDNHRLALPNKLFEYVAAGVPVVAADLPELRAFMGAYGVGWTAAPHDAAALARVLRKALDGSDDPALMERLASAGRDLQWTNEREHLLKLYRWLDSLEPPDYFTPANGQPEKSSCHVS
jgi:glycosyltransferase involved in cell wall biosynthesis